MGGNHPQKKRKKKRKEKVCGDQLVYIDDKNFEKHGWWISIHIFHHTLLISWQSHSFSNLYHTTCLNCTQMMSPDVTRCRLKRKNGGNWKENKNLRKSCWVHLNLSCLYYILFVWTKWRQGATATLAGDAKDGEHPCIFLDEWFFVLGHEKHGHASIRTIFSYIQCAFVLVYLCICSCKTFWNLSLFLFRYNWFFFFLIIR